MRYIRNVSPSHYNHDYLLCFILCQWLPCLLVPVANKGHLGLRSTSGSKIRVPPLRSKPHYNEITFISPVFKGRYDNNGRQRELQLIALCQIRDRVRGTRIAHIHRLFHFVGSLRTGKAHRKFRTASGQFMKLFQLLKLPSRVLLCP